jgi:hypothetical protein
MDEGVARDWVEGPVEPARNRAWVTVPACERKRWLDQTESGEATSGCSAPDEHLTA